jgi:hypothetical protein
VTGQPPPTTRLPGPADRPRHRGLGCLPTALLAAVVLVLVFATGALLAARYLPWIDDARSVRSTAERLADEFRALQPADLDRATVDGLRADVADLDHHLVPLADALDDPLVRAARAVPGVSDQVAAAGALLGAAGDLVDAADIGLGLADRVVTLREADAADASVGMMAGLVELMATSQDDVDRLAQLLDAADAQLSAIGPDALSQLRSARDLVARPLADYQPLLDQYRELDGVVPALLGWGGDKRYLVLAENPAELRPAGGYAGTVGLITLRDGALVSQQFQNVYDLDQQKDLPFVKPPEELADNLLVSDEQGNPQSWRLADAAWSPDFPTGARKAAEFYAIEADGTQVDGVIAITTFALDRLLEVLGPVEVPAYGVTVAPGDTTLTLLGATRGKPGELEGRKDVLDALGTEVMHRLLALPPEEWTGMLEALADIGREREALVWLADPEAQRLIVEHGLAGQVRTDPGDYLYVVESNVAPTSKYNLVVDRSDSLVVKLGEDGAALDSLRLDWQNHAGDDGELYQQLRSFSQNEQGWYGAYVRVLVPTGSELVTASGRDIDQVSGVERVTQEAGRTSFANDLLMVPGTSTMSYLWTVPQAAEETEHGWEYRLTVQKQPGARTFPLSVRVDLPPGASVLETSPGAQIDGQRVHLTASLDGDVELFVRYDLPTAAG